MCQRVLTFGDVEITKRKSTILNTHLICTMLPYNFRLVIYVLNILIQPKMSIYTKRVDETKYMVFY